MKMNCRLMLIVLAGFLSASSAMAADNAPQKKGANCPANFDVDDELGPGTTAVTTCIAKRDDIKVVLNLSTGVTNPKSGFSQTLSNAISMTDNYRGTYGIPIGKGLEFSIVAHFIGARFLLSDAAYNKVAGVSTGNPSRRAVQALLDRGVHIYMCQLTMRNSGWMTEDLIPGVEQVPGGVVALADFALRGWAVITP
jgi:intracellular sulfur oxidation DsrE/DsrF family protein